MKNKTYIFLFLLSITYLFAAMTENPASAKNKNDIFKRPPLDVRKENFVKIKDKLSLDETELYDFNSIKENEEEILRPIALELEAKYLRLDELNEIRCKWYQRTCKKELKYNEQFLADDIKELRRQIWQKKEYYKILYLNAATHEQDVKLRQMIYNETNGKPQLW